MGIGSALVKAMVGRKRVSEINVENYRFEVLRASNGAHIEVFIN